MKNRVLETLQPTPLQYAQATEDACCAQPADGSACCNKEVDTDDCCVQPTDASSCC